MLNIRITDDSVEIEGYVNAVERPSKVLEDRSGEFTETIKKGAFRAALERADDVRILLNHDAQRDLGGIRDGNLELHEDAIGLHANATIRDAEVIDLAKRDAFTGWSFGFYDREVEYRIDDDGRVARSVRDLDLEEVSLLDNTRSPAYEGTLVTVRESDGKRLKYGALLKRDDSPVPDEKPAENAVSEPSEEPEAEDIDYSEYEEMIRAMKEGEKNDV